MSFKFMRWGLQANKLTLNMTKTEFMLIGSRQRLNTLTTSPIIRTKNTTDPCARASDLEITWRKSAESRCTEKKSGGLDALCVQRLRCFNALESCFYFCFFSFLFLKEWWVNPSRSHRSRSSTKNHDSQSWASIQENRGLLYACSKTFRIWKHLYDQTRTGIFHFVGA